MVVGSRSRKGEGGMGKGQHRQTEVIQGVHDNVKLLEEGCSEPRLLDVATIGGDLRFRLKL